MMSLTERLVYLIIGCFIGFMCGYIVRSLKDIKHDVQELHKERHVDKDKGTISNDLLTKIALFIVVALTAYAAFASQLASNKSDNATDNVNHQNVVNCQNGNESRAANKQLWDFVIAVSLSSPANKGSKRATAFLHRIQDWIDSVYRPHDCNDLSKKYPIPPPPKIISFPKHKHKH